MNRAGLTIEKLNGEREVFSIMPAPSSADTRSFLSSVRPFEMAHKAWEPGDPELPFRRALHPWDGGIAGDRFGTGLKRSYAGANADLTQPGLLLWPPKLYPLTLTGATAPAIRAQQFDNFLFINGQRYMFTLNAAMAVAVDKDFGASKAATTMAPFNGQLVVGMGETEKLYTREVAALALSGTANAAVTTTNTTLTDTRLAMVVSAYVGATITCGGKTMVVTANTATVFSGTAWSGGGNPGNGLAWSVAGSWWTQAIENTFARSLGTSGKYLYRAESLYLASNALSAPRSLASWAPAAAGNKYKVGDATFATNDDIADYAGTPWVLKPNGAFSSDNATVFYNQSPNIAKVPDDDAGKGWWTGDRSLWVPTDQGLFRLRQGEAFPYGPDLTNRRNYRFRVMAGLEFGGEQFIVTTDQDAVGYTSIYRMVKDRYGFSPHQLPYIYHEWVRLPGTGTSQFIALYPAATGGPKLVVGYQNDAYYIKLGRGGGSMANDPSYEFGTDMELDIGPVQVGPDLAVRATLTGVQVLLNLPTATQARVQVYGAMNEEAYEQLSSSQEEGGRDFLGITDGYEKHSMYARPGMEGNYIRVKLTGQLVTATGANRPEVREVWAFGWLRPENLDVLSVTLIAEGTGRSVYGTNPGMSAEDIHQYFCDLHDGMEPVAVEIEGYSLDNIARWFVSKVDLTDQRMNMDPAGGAASQRIVRVNFVRAKYSREHTND